MRDDHDIYNIYNIYENCGVGSYKMELLNLSKKNNYSEYVHREGFKIFEEKIPKQSDNMIEEDNNILYMIGMYHGYNISYIYTSMSEEEKERFLKYHQIYSVNKNEATVMNDMQEIMEKIFEDIYIQISKIKECCKETIMNIYKESTKKYISPDAYKYFIFPDTILNRHISHIKNVIEFQKSRLISKKEVENVDIKLYMAENIDNYYLLMKRVLSNKLFKIPINDITIDIFSILMNESEDNILSDKWLNLAVNLRREYNVNFDDIKLKDMNDIKKYLLNLVDKLFG